MKEFYRFFSLGSLRVLVKSLSYIFFCLHNYSVIKLKLKNKIKFDTKNMYRAIREAGFMV